jgi:hypothetical protein
MTLDRDNLARQIANHGTNGVEDIDPDVEDYRFADYLIRTAYDIHGYSLGFRRLIGGFLMAVLVAVLIVTAHAWSAQ